MTQTQIYFAVATLFAAIPFVYYGIRAWNKRKANKSGFDHSTYMPKSTTLNLNPKKPINVGGKVASFFSAIGGILSSMIPNKGVRFESFADFFAWFAGADLEVWRTMPSPVRKKRTGFGMLVFAVIAASAFLAGRTWGDIFHSQTAGIVIGIGWFFLIWALDRAVIVFMDNDHSNKRAVVLARFAMIFCIAFVNTTFIAMETFSTEIATQIRKNKDNQKALVADSITNVKNNLQKQRDAEFATMTSFSDAYTTATGTQQQLIDSQRATIAARRNELIGEVQGNIGSGKKGYGDAAKTKQAMLEQDEATLATMIARFDETKTSSPEYLALQDAKAKYQRREEQLVAEIAKADAFMASQTETITDSKQDGYADRSQAMWLVAKDNKILFFFFFLFFLTLESMAVLMKLMSGKDNYDEAVRLIKNEHAVMNQQAKALDLQTKTNSYQINMAGLIENSIGTQVTHANKVKSSLISLYNSSYDKLQLAQQHLNAMEALEFDDPEVGKAVKDQLKQQYISQFTSIGSQLN